MGLLPLEARKTPITVIGAGSTGSFTVLALAKMGFGNITVWDFDTVELHNVDNQVYGPNMVGFSKVAALEEVISQLAGVCITPWDFPFPLTEPVKPNEIVILATDSITSRREIWDAIKFSPFRALIDSRMAAEQFSVYTVDPKNYTDQMRYEQTFFPASEAVAERCTEKSIMYTPLILGGVIANQVKRILAGNTVKPAITMSMKEYQIVFM
jgi:molybdopterin/thiamine biosynthesis adenylyltransferase